MTDAGGLAQVWEAVAEGEEKVLDYYFVGAKMI